MALKNEDCDIHCYDMVQVYMCYQNFGGILYLILRVQVTFTQKTKVL